MTPRYRRPVFIEAMGHHHPDELIANSFFEELDIDTTSEWITERTGIVERRSLLSKEQIRDLRYGRSDWQKLLPEIFSLAQFTTRAFELAQKRGIGGPIDAVISGVSIPDYVVPANACSIAAALKLKCLAFDVNSACSSFILALQCAAQLVANGDHERVLVAVPERYTLRLNYTDRASCILFGDGCAVAVVSSSEKHGRLELVDVIATSDPTDFALVQTTHLGLFQQNGRAVQKFAVTRTVEVVQTLCMRSGITVENLSGFVAHQANLRMLLSAAEKLKLSPEKNWYNVDKFGNQGAAGAPATLSQHWDTLNSAEWIAMPLVGAGLTWGGALFRVI